MQDDWAGESSMITLRASLQKGISTFFYLQLQSRYLWYFNLTILYHNNGSYCIWAVTGSSISSEEDFSRRYNYVQRSIWWMISTQPDMLMRFHFPHHSDSHPCLLAHHLRHPRNSCLMDSIALHHPLPLCHLLLAACACVSCDDFGTKL